MALNKEPHLNDHAILQLFSAPPPGPLATAPEAAGAWGPAPDPRPGIPVGGQAGSYRPVVWSKPLEQTWSRLGLSDVPQNGHKSYLH